MKQLIECVPNISEGKDLKKIERIALAAGRAGISVIDIDCNPSANRTVITLIGEPQAIAEGAFALMAEASKEIDMRKHRGAHPRIGATDVCPFVPLRNVSMGECVKISRQIAERVSRDLHIPVFLYGEAALLENRREIAPLRRGEYEGLQTKLSQPEFKPDFGPAKPNLHSGASIIGARDILIAYNVNLDCKDSHKASRIAASLRESGFVKEKPGRFKACKALGWYMQHFGRTQVSFNLTNYEVTGLHDVFDAACELAEKLGTAVTGSEIVGLVPNAALLAAGRHFCDKAQPKGPALNAGRLIEIAVKALGLDDLYSFNPKKKIIEERLFSSDNAETRLL